jgi:hypothetical protein
MLPLSPAAAGLQIWILTSSFTSGNDPIPILPR